jgi:hypothetical protein
LSPLLPSLSLPAGFSIEKTPLATFRRVDLLLDQSELVDLHRKTYNPPANFTLFSDEKSWNLSPRDYMPLFLGSLPEANYATLVVNTAGHWTTTVFSGFRDESKETSGYGIDGVLSFFKVAMHKFAQDVQTALNEDRIWGDRPSSGKRPRTVLVRAYLPGHEDCHNWRKPWTLDLGFQWQWYNWPWIKDFNQIFQVGCFALAELTRVYLLE